MSTELQAVCAPMNSLTNKVELVNTDVKIREMTHSFVNSPYMYVMHSIIKFTESKYRQLQRIATG